MPRPYANVWAGVPGEAGIPGARNRHCCGYIISMLSLPLFLSLLVSSQPMDTGLVVQACRTPTSSVDTSLAVRVWNPSHRTVTNLVLRLHLNGAPGSFDDFGLRPLYMTQVDASGVPSSAMLSLPEVTTPPVLERAGCTGDTCSHLLSVSLGTVSLAPLEGLTIELRPAKISGGALQWEPPSRPFRLSDWSLSNLGPAQATPATDLGSKQRATRIELFADGTRVWGNAPGESFERPDWPLFNASRSSFASLVHVPSDTIPVVQRDDANQHLSSWLVNQAGYRLSDVQAGRTRVLGVGLRDWNLVDTLGRVLGSGSAAPLGGPISGALLIREYANSITLLRDSLGDTRSGDAYGFPLPKTLPAGGPYRIVSASDTSAPFRVDDDIYGKLRDAALRFFGVQRSGNSSSWFHPASFAGDAIPGGWYDCGDRLKEGITQGYALEVLGELAATHPERDPDRTSYRQDLETPDGVPDLVRELRHGADYALASWDLSGGNPADMITSVGSSADHLAWIHDVWTDLLPAAKGGPGSRTARKEMGGNIAGSWAAGLAFSARLEAATDPDFAARALVAAKGLYAWGKANPAAKKNALSTYISSESTAKLALAAVALLWATRDTSYLHDLVRNDSLSKRSPLFWYSLGGWFGKGGTQIPLGKGGWPMDFDDPHPLALHAFAKLVLPDPDTALRYGVATAQYDSLREATLYGMLRNTAEMSIGNRSMPLSVSTFSVDSLWRVPVPAITWSYSRYFTGMLGEMLLCAEMARDAASRPTPHYPAGTDLGADSLEAMAVRGMDYLLGTNPWSISFLQGIGSRNLNHIHHRSANPDGCNMTTVNWAYRTPVGALLAGGNPSTTLLRDEWSKYDNTEACLDFATSFLVPTTLLSAQSSQTPVAIGHRTTAATGRTTRLFWDPRTGLLRWSGLTGTLRFEVLDSRGRVVASGSASEASGNRSLELPAGLSLLRWRSADASGVLPLLHLSR